MAVTSGFFNSNNGDRIYDAEDINEFFSGVIAEGVFSTIGNAFAVTATSGMQLKVGTGRAWFLKSWILNTSDDYHTLDDADATYDRIDIVALEFDKDNAVRKNDIIIVKGTPAASPSAPTLVSTATKLQIPLAEVYIDAASSSFNQTDITNKIGTVDCPFVTGLIDQIDIDILLQQWEADYVEWKAGIEADLAAIDDSSVLTELADMRQRPVLYRNILINGDMSVCQMQDESGTSDDVTGYDGGTPPAISSKYNARMPDRWGFEMYDAGTWTLSRGTLSDGRRTVKATCTTAKASLSSSSNAQFVQEIEAETLAELYKGFLNAKDMYLSFDFKSNVTGTFIVEVEDRQNNWSISKSFSCAVADTWESFEILIPKETSQKLTLDETAGLTLCFWFAAGSNYNSTGPLQTTWAATTQNNRAYGQNNLAVSVNNYFEITDVQLEYGTKKTTYERLPYSENLKRCRRYMEFQHVFNFIGIADDSDVIYSFGTQYDVPKRIAPSLYDTRDYTVPTFVLQGMTTPYTGITLSNVNLFTSSPNFNHKEALHFYADADSTVVANRPYFGQVVWLRIDAEIV